MTFDQMMRRVLGIGKVRPMTDETKGALEAAASDCDAKALAADMNAAAIKSLDKWERAGDEAEREADTWREAASMLRARANR